METEVEEFALWVAITGVAANAVPNGVAKNNEQTFTRSSYDEDLRIGNSWWHTITNLAVCQRT